MSEFSLTPIVPKRTSDLPHLAGIALTALACLLAALAALVGGAI